MNKEYLYAVKHPDGFWKIGKSKKPYNRVDGIQTGSPYELQFKYAVEYYSGFDSPDVEGEVHNRLEEYQVSGEWFDVGEGRVVELFKTLVKSDMQEPYRFYDVKKLEEQQTTNRVQRRARL